MLHLALDRTVEPNPPAEGRVIDQTSGEGVGQLKGETPLSRGVNVVVVKSITTERDGVVQLPFSKQGPSPHPNSRTIMAVHTCAWLQGECASGVDHDLAINDVGQIGRPHFVAREGGELIGSPMEHGILSTRHQLDKLVVAVGGKAQILNDPKRDAPSILIGVDSHLNEDIHAVSGLKRHVTDRL